MQQQKQSKAVTNRILAKYYLERRKLVRGPDRRKNLAAESDVAARVTAEQRAYERRNAEERASSLHRIHKQKLDRRMGLLKRFKGEG